MKFSWVHVSKNLQKLETKLTQKPYYMSGHVLSKDDSVRWGTGILLWNYLAVDVAKKLGQYDSNFHRLLSPQTISIFGLSTSYLPVDFVIDQLKSMLLIFRNACPQGMAFSKFSKLCQENGVDRRVCSGFPNEFIGLNTVYRTVRYALTRGDLRLVDYGRALREVNTLLQFLTRLTLNDVEWIEEEEVQKYFDMERRLKNQTYPASTIEELRIIVADWLADFDWRAGDCDSHGYGATKDVKRSAGTAQKWLQMQVHQGLEHWGLNDLLNAEIHKACETALEYRFDRVQHGSLPPLDDSYYGRYCRYNLVPKGVNKKRGVSLEDTVNQFYQKIMFDRFDLHFKRHPEIGVHLHNQSFSRLLALIGSKTKEFGTLDLSSASDTVTWTLIRSIFPAHIVDVIDRVRTRWCLVEKADRFVRMEKAFPMGSALCFPLESLTFAAICELANRRAGIHRKKLVYGDDMVVHKDVAEDIASLLEELHFDLNREKSYFPGSSFTEACGIECYEGFDISPLRISRKFDAVKLLKHTLPGLELARDLANKAYVSGYPELRKALVRLSRNTKYPLFFSSDDERFWYSPEPLNQSFTIKRQCLTAEGAETKTWGPRRVRIQVMQSRITHDERAEALRYERWFECRASRTHLLESWMTPEQCTRVLNMDGPGPEVGAALTRAQWEWITLPS